MSLTISTMVRNEAAYLPEWIAAHLLLGVTSFRIYDNDSDDDTAALLRRLATVLPVQRIAWPGHGINVQIAAFNDALAALRGKADFLACIDVDEFLYSRGFASLAQVLATYPAGVGAIGINQRVFGSSGHVERGPEPVIARFTRRARDEYAEHRWIKTIARPGATSCFGTSHHVELRTGAYVLADGRPFEARTHHLGEVDRIADGPIYLNHYMLRSLQEFRAKQQRGANSDAADRGGYRRLTDQYFFHREGVVNEVEDHVLAGLVPNLTAALKDMAALLGPGTPAPGAAPSAPSALTDQPEQLAERAYRVLGEGDAVEAERIFRLASALDPVNRGILFGLSHALARQRRAQEALVFAERAGVRAEDFAEQAHHGYLLRALGQWGAAAGAFIRALGINPDAGAIRTVLAEVLAKAQAIQDPGTAPMPATPEGSPGGLPPEGHPPASPPAPSVGPAIVVADKQARGKTLAVVTMVYNEPDFLPIWLRYYSGQVGRRNCFVIDHGSDDGSTAHLDGLSQVILPRTPTDERRRAEYVSMFCTSLLQWYDFVAYADVDEILVADPRRHKTLLEYCTAAPHAVTTAFGMNLIHRLHHETALDLARPVLEQRQWVVPAASMCKPLLTRVPIRWDPGFHSSDAPLAFDDLLLFHLAYVDLPIARRRQAKRRATPMQRESPNHHHRASDQAIFALMEGWSRMPREDRIGLGQDCRFRDEFAQRVIASRRTRENDVFKLDLGIWGKQLWRLPGALRSCL